MVGRNRKFLGLVTLKRLKSLLQTEGASVKDALEPDPPKTDPDAVLEDLFPIAAESDYPIAVVDEDGRFMFDESNNLILLNDADEIITDADIIDKYKYNGTVVEYSDDITTVAMTSISKVR